MRFPLKPTSAQAEILKDLFEGPLFVQRLLALTPVPVQTAAAAAAFLDRHWNRLVPYMFSGQGGRSPKAMEALILEMATGDLDEFCLDFPAGCMLTQQHSVRFPVPGLGPVAVRNSGELGSARLHRKHSGSFGLIAAGASGFAVAIDFERIVRPLTPPIVPVVPRGAPRPSVELSRNRASQQHPVRQPPRPQLPQQEPRRKGMAAETFLRMFNNRVTAHLQDQLRISRQFTTTRFEDLSGWGVSGGLPSLPRRQ